MRLIAIGLAALVGTSGAFGARASGIHPVKITSGSMAPTIDRGDWIVVKNLDRGDRDSIARGDIVMFRFPLGTSGRAIKRVVAVAGDHVVIGSHRVSVNGRSIAVGGAPSAYAGGARAETVPAGDVFLLGDHAAVSIDSRSFGPIPTSEIVARQVLTFRL